MFENLAAKKYFSPFKKDGSITSGTLWLSLVVILQD
jgi:hypothetical protein